jgi:hypothetical protein
MLTTELRDWAAGFGMLDDGDDLAVRKNTMSSRKISLVRLGENSTSDEY